MTKSELAVLMLNKVVSALVVGFVTATSWLASSSDAFSQSRYACSALSGGTLPVVEGVGGMFFRPDPDLIVDARFPLPIIERIAQVSRTLESRGSRLVVVPVPGKGLIFPEALGAAAQTYGFDVELAARLYSDTVARLESRGVVTVDALDALRGWTDEPSMFASDHRLTNAGIRLLADATAARIGSTGEGRRFSVSAAGTVEVPSLPHQQIQARCILNIPAPVTTAYDTVSLIASTGSEEILLADSGLMAGEGLMPRAFFATALGQDVRHVVAENAPLDALLALVSSETFYMRAPKVVVWTMPVTEDLGAYGDRPWSEIKGMARRSCRAVPMEDAVRSENTIDVSLSDLAVTRDLGLLVSLDETKSLEANFVFETDNGATHRRTIKRFGLIDGTQSFLTPLDGRPGAALSSVRITVASGLGDVPSLAFCGI